MKIILRSARLLLGLGLFGAGIALMIRAELGLSSWDVLHDAIGERSPLSFGQSVVVVSTVVVLACLLLRMNFGPGTIANVFLIGTFTDFVLWTRVVNPIADGHLAVRGAASVGGVLLIALGTALYMGADLGAGPRDTLMMAISKRAGVSMGTARAVIEIVVLVIGVLLGGAVGIGTLLFAILIGPAVHLAFRAFGMETHVAREVAMEGER